MPVVEETALEELALRDDGSDVLLPVRARPRARRNTLDGVREGALLVSVTAPPEDGKANEAILQLLAKTLRVGKSALSIERGETSREKTIRVWALSAADVRERLAG